MPINLPLDHMNVTFHFATVGAAGDSVMTLGIDQSASSASDQEDLQAIWDNFTTTVMLRMPGAVTLTNLTAISMGIGGPQSFEVPVAHNGALSGELMPANVAILVQKLTGFAGKKNRGRMFQPGVDKIASQASNGNLMVQSQLDVLQGKWDEFYTGLIVANLLPCILHQQGVADPPRAVTQFVVQSRFATQRGRLRD